MTERTGQKSRYAAVILILPFAAEALWAADIRTPFPAVSAFAQSMDPRILFRSTGLYLLVHIVVAMAAPAELPHVRRDVMSGSASVSQPHAPYVGPPAGYRIKSMAARGKR